MTRPYLEPGLLKIFKWFAIGRLALLVLATVSRLWLPEPRTFRYPIFGIVELVLLLVLLTWPWAQRWLGRAFLPLALTLASGGPIVGHAIAIGLRLLQGVPAADAMTDAWQLILVLFVPLILVAWQYDFPAVVGFVLATTGLDFALTVILAVVGRYRAVQVAAVIVLRALVYGLVGYVVVALMDAQREQRASLAEANAQLARYATTLEQLTLSRERNRMARELHDTLAHSLSAVAVQLEATRALWDEDATAARGMLDRALGMTRQGLGEARRAIHALRASPLDDLGLALALRRAAETAADRGGLSLAIEVSERADEMPREVAQAVYRVATEAMENVVRHAQASILRVDMVDDGSQWVLTIIDNGCGFDVSQVPGQRYGLQGMRERSAMISAELVIESSIGGGTSVQMRI